MIRPDYIIVGPDPRRKKVAHPGGQLTATTGLLQFAEETGLRLAFIDTLQSSFPPPPGIVRGAKVLRRQLQFLWYATIRRPKKGAVIFAAGPGSFVDRGFTGLIARVFGVKAVICLRSGHLIPYLGNKSTLGRVISKLVRAQPRLLVQGKNWLTYLDSAGVDRTRINVVPNWIPPEKFHADPEPKQIVNRPVRFIFVGWIVAEKGVRELISACELLRDSGRPFHMTLVGGGTLLKELQQSIDAKGLADTVSLTGWVPPADVRDHIKQADVFVLPTYFEGFPNALLEALALGLPAISTPVGAIPDSLEDGVNGFLIEPRNTRQLADAMRRYIDLTDLVEQHATKAHETVKSRHDFRTNCARLFAVVDN